MKTLIYSLRNWLMFQTHRQLSHQYAWVLKCHFVSNDQVADTKNLVTEMMLASVGLSHITGDPITKRTYLTKIQKNILKIVTDAGYQVYLSGRWDASC